METCGNDFKILTGKPTVNRLLARPGCKLEESIRIALK
jgi:hypothetical protein